MEFRLLLRNGEQVGLTLVIPLLLEFFFNLPLLYSVGPRRIDFVVPSILALSVMSAAFTGLAIGTGFERKYGVLKRLGRDRAAPLGAARRQDAGVLALEIVQVVLICGLGLALGWHPHGDPALVLVLLVLGTVAFGGLGLLLAGTLRAEVTLAAANLVWLVLLFAGGIAIPLTKFPHGVARGAAVPAVGGAVRRPAPGAAGRRGLPGRARSLTLLVWAAVAVPAAARWFRWE